MYSFLCLCLIVSKETVLQPFDSRCHVPSALQKVNGASDEEVHDINRALPSLP